MLSRDDSSMYKVAGSNNSNRSLASLSDTEDTHFTSADQLAHHEAAALALAVAQIEEMELVDQSNYNVDLQDEVEVEVEVEVKQAGQSVIAKPMKEKKEIKKIKKSSAPALDGWGTAIKTVGIGAPVKKAVTGLSLAKPIKKSSTSSSVGKIESTGGAAVTTSRSFDDLKQIGRYQRDLEEQHQLQLDAGMQLQLEAKKSHSEKKEASFGVDDFPVLGGYGRSGSAPHPHSSINSKHSNNNYSNSSSSSSGGAESIGTGSAPALSVEQRNENIRAFVQEARMKKALNSPPLDVDLYDSDPYAYDDGSYGGSNYFDGVNSNISSSSSKVHEKEKEKEKSSGTGNGMEKSAARVGNWTKMGGVSAAPVPVPASNDDDEYEFFDYTQSTAPISFNDSDYPSLGPGPPKKDVNVRSNGNGKNTAAALASGISRPAKTAADLLLAKKEKTNKRIGNLTQDMGVSKA